MLLSSLVPQEVWASNYSELRVEIPLVWNMGREVAFVVICALGSTKNLHHHLKSLGIKVHVSSLLKSVLFTTANVLRKVPSV